MILLAAMDNLATLSGINFKQLETDLISHLKCLPDSKGSRQLETALCYPVAAGGKRIRPILLNLVAKVFGGSEAEELSRKACVALEYVHTYSLVHDDLPSFDNDSLRRGKPTTHIVFGEAQAILVGDALLTLSFEILSDYRNTSPALAAELCHVLAKAAGPSGMVLGQWIDMQTENAKSFSELKNLHLLKTGKLIGTAFEMGYLCAQYTNQDEKIRKKMILLGEKLGFCFQLVDDLIDVTGTKTSLGKTPGKDSNLNKLTAVKILGLDETKALATRLTEEILEELTSLPMSSPDGLSTLKKLIESLLVRSH